MNKTTDYRLCWKEYAGLSRLIWFLRWIPLLMQPWRASSLLPRLNWGSFACYTPSSHSNISILWITRIQRSHCLSSFITAFRCYRANYLPLLKPPGWLTSLDQLACHEESSGTCGAVVVNVDNGDASQTQAVVNGPLSTCGVTWNREVGWDANLHLFHFTCAEKYMKDA